MLLLARGRSATCLPLFLRRDQSLPITRWSVTGWNETSSSSPGFTFSPVCHGFSFIGRQQRDALGVGGVGNGGGGEESNSHALRYSPRFGDECNIQPPAVWLAARVVSNSSRSRRLRAALKKRLQLTSTHIFLLFEPPSLAKAKSLIFVAHQLQIFFQTHINKTYSGKLLLSVLNTNVNLEYIKRVIFADFFLRCCHFMNNEPNVSACKNKRGKKK